MRCALPLLLRAASRRVSRGGGGASAASALFSATWSIPRHISSCALAPRAHTARRGSRSGSAGRARGRSPRGRARGGSTCLPVEVPGRDVEERPLGRRPGVDDHADVAAAHVHVACDAVDGQRPVGALDAGRRRRRDAGAAAGGEQRVREEGRAVVATQVREAASRVQSGPVVPAGQGARPGPRAASSRAASPSAGQADAGTVRRGAVREVVAPASRSSRPPGRGSRDPPEGRRCAPVPTPRPTAASRREPGGRRGSGRTGVGPAVARPAPALRATVEARRCGGLRPGGLEQDHMVHLRGGDRGRSLQP